METRPHQSTQNTVEKQLSVGTEDFSTTFSVILQ